MKVGHKPISLRVEMAAYSVVFLVCLFQIGFALDPSKTAMNIHQVVPDVIDVAPTNTISVRNHFTTDTTACEMKFKTCNVN